MPEVGALSSGQHALPNDILKDRQRDAWLEKEGYTVVRFWDNEVLTNTSGVLEVIRERLHKTPSPQSPPLTKSRCFKQGRGSNYPHKMRKNHKIYWNAISPYPSRNKSYRLF